MSSHVPTYRFHPDSIAATLTYKLPMFLLGVTIGFIVYRVADYLFVSA